MTTCRSDPAGPVGFLAFGKDGGLRLVRPDLVHAACCRADRRLVRTGLYLSGFTFPGAAFREHFLTHGRKDWTGPCGSDLLRWDVDRAGDVAAALSDARRLAAYLIDRYRLDEGQVLVGLSGAKGYHVEIPFGPVDPADYVPATVRRLCQSAADAMRIGAFDPSVYDRTRLWRTWNSRHERTGRFKRRLSVGELLYLDQDRHAELAREPFAFDPPDPVKSALLDQDWTRALAAARAVPRVQTPEVARHRGGALTDRAGRFLLGQATQPRRHDGCVHAAAVLARAGCPKGLAFDLLFRAAHACGLVRDYDRRDVLRAIENGWRRGRDELARLAREDGDDDSFG
jgi:hypothetical protein